MNTKVDILNQAIANLPDKWGVNLVSERGPGGDLDAVNDIDGKLALFNGGYQFNLAIKRIHRKESLTALSGSFPVNTILVCNTLTPFLADYCEQLGINFFDASGNARIHYNDLHLHVQGKKSKSLNQSPVSAGKTLSEGIMKLVFVLLNKRSFLSLPYRELANYAGISLGMVSKGMRFLEEQKYIRPSGAGKRLIENGKPLQEKWIRDYPTVLRPKFNGVMLDYPNHWQHLLTLLDYIVGGEIAAAKLTQYLEPEQQLLFTHKSLQRSIKELGARPDVNGKLWLVQAFWDRELAISDYGLALLSAAELTCTPDPRNQESAKILYEQYLATD